MTSRKMNFKKAIIGIASFVAILLPSLVVAQIPVEEWIARYDSGAKDEATAFALDSMGMTALEVKNGLEEFMVVGQMMVLTQLLWMKKTTYMWLVEVHFLTMVVIMLP